MSNSINRSQLTQSEKYQNFKKAFDLINKLRSEGHYIPSYVLLYSIIEDRMNALYVVRTYLSKDIPISKETIRKATRARFTDKVDALLKAEDISHKLQNDLKSEAKNRNNKFHNALWHYEDFKEEDIKRLLKLVREVDKARRDQKKRLGK